MSDELELEAICDVCKYKERECHCLKCEATGCTNFAIYCEHGYYNEVRIYGNKDVLFGVPSDLLKIHTLGNYQ